jgi:excisionase family DNA binding protein
MSSEPIEPARYPRLALTPEELAMSIGCGRDMVFDAIREGKLLARKPGSRTTLIEIEEARRWIASMPTRGRSALQANAA